ncbi:acyl-ACP--UDP-N-acetylglucosamine O-acyltransferase [Coraliomargarita sp. SDUM461004]|uniref:Acyl-ACP--UDP-N-acetylglucosamine O-acyltransferase n=1 Tax=Thalassobacterium sedimentorum TaxID=3041258 RepID=A0ABU1AIG2_9BACT|nr:acyl-ACP--UDP-N-acetylglucosamine O-acyltransferase [Coraliomargarita sp. SDUM461004]MDQ8194534.1 acyl-ACP--UDP-N-acetylglucosamine O-acyltransferase [Coraliomargarita sp. SDUM461004]
MNIHQTAIVDPSAKIGEGTSIGAGALIESNVRIGRDCKIAAYAIIRENTTIGNAVQVDSFCVIGGEPQSIGFDSSLESTVVIGDRVILREGVTVSRPETAGAETVIGDECFIMANAHVAHDCQLSRGVVMVNNVMLAGHVRVGEKTVIGGGAGIHQFCRIGAYCMIAGNASITADVPPYVMAAERSEAHGLNLVGLRRGGFEQREIKDLKRCYRAVFFGGGNLKKKAAEAARETEFGMTAAGARFLSFFETGKRGFILSTRD